jgi:hypothetical protein
MRGVLGSVLWRRGEPELRFRFSAGTGLESIEGLLPYSVRICKSESIEGQHTYFCLFLSGVQSAFDSCSVNLPTASHGFLCERQLMPMPEDIEVFKAVPGLPSLL